MSYDSGYNGIIKIARASNGGQLTIDASNLTSDQTLRTQEKSGVIALNGYVSGGDAGDTYSILDTDYFLLFHTQNFTATLPDATGLDSKVYILKVIDNITVTVNTTSSQTIDGNLTVTLNQYDSLTVVSDGSNWLII